MKTVTLYRPMSIEKAMSDFDRYMESFFGESLLASASKNLHLPVMDIQEKESAYSVEMELPGFDEESIEVNVNGKEVTVKSKQEESSQIAADNSVEKTEAEKERFLLKERRSSHFSRTFSLPENADYESITAVFKNGVLSLNVKKIPEAQKRTIQINAS
jgi:HSP20 family protein